MVEQSKPLTDEQVAFYRAFGFVAMRQCFTGAELTAIEDDFNAAMDDGRKGEAFDGRERQVVSDQIQHRPAIARMLADQRVGGSVKRLLGEDCFLQSTDANLYVGDTGWHADHGWHPSMLGNPPTEEFYRDRYHPGLKVALYLDPVGSQSGCLRAIPGSHISPYHESLHSMYYTLRPGALAGAGEVDFGLEPQDIACYPIESQPGDVVFFSHLMWHASFGGHSGRRMFAMNFKAAEDQEAKADG